MSILTHEFDDKSSCTGPPLRQIAETLHVWRRALPDAPRAGAMVEPRPPGHRPVLVATSPYEAEKPFWRA